MRLKETTQRAWVKCARALGKTHNGGLKTLQISVEEGTDPKTCKDWKHVENQEEIQDHLR